LAFSQPRGATYPRRFPTRRLCCALRVSHPLDALLPARPAELISSRSHPWGSLLEAFTLERCRTPSQTPLPSWGSDFASAEAPPAPPGIEHIARRPIREYWGLTRTLASRASSSFSPLQGLLRTALTWPVLASPCPLTRFSDELFELIPSLAPQGFKCGARSRSLSRPAQPPWGFLPLDPSHRWGPPQDWVMNSPRRPAPVAGCSASSSPARRVPYRSR
jgi:hypothetical protein